MDSIKKLEEKWMMNQQRHASDENMVGLKDDGSDVTSKGEVILSYFATFEISWSVILVRWC